MNKEWAKSKVSFEDETWSFNLSEKPLEALWKKTLRLVNPDTKKELLQLENVIKNMLLVHAFQEGWKRGKVN